jgi:DNA-binding transcriptional ArsR family regulator
MANISQKWLNEKDFEILSVFANDYSFRVHESEIVRKLKIPQRTISRKLNALNKKGFLKYTREGKNKVYSLDKDSFLFFQILMLTESYKSLKFLLEQNKLAILLRELNVSLLIFGSYAKRTQNSSSDLDVVLFCKKTKGIMNIIKKFPIEIHAQFSTINEFREKLLKKDTLALEIEKNHIIIQGFDELIKIFMEKLYE